MLVIRGFKQLGGFRGTDNGTRREDLRWLAGFRQSIRNFGFDGVHEQATADGAAGGDGGIEAIDLDHGVANGCAGVEDDVGKILELLTVAMAAGAGFAVGGADDGGDFDAALLKLLGHFDGNDVAAAAGDDEGAVAGHEVEVPQNPIRQASHIFEKHGLTLAVRADDEIVEGQRELDDGIEAWKRAVTRPHFLHENATVAGAKDMHHLSGQNRLGEHVRSLLDERKLVSDSIEEALAGFEVLERGSHEGIEWFSVNHRGTMDTEF